MKHVPLRKSLVEIIYRSFDGGQYICGILPWQRGVSGELPEVERVEYFSPFRFPEIGERVPERLLRLVGRSVQGETRRGGQRGSIKAAGFIFSYPSEQAQDSHRIS